MKKYIEFSLKINNPSQPALEEILNAVDNCVDDLEHLQTIAELEIKYTKE